MPAIIDQGRGEVRFTCDVCGREAVVSLELKNGLDWRLKDGTKAFCSFDCEMDFQAKEVEE